MLVYNSCYYLSSNEDEVLMRVHYVDAGLSTASHAILGGAVTTTVVLPRIFFTPSKQIL